MIVRVVLEGCGAIDGGAVVKRRAVMLCVAVPSGAGCGSCVAGAGIFPSLQKKCFEKLKVHFNKHCALSVELPKLIFLIFPNL